MRTTSAAAEIRFANRSGPPLVAAKKLEFVWTLPLTVNAWSGKKLMSWVDKTPNSKIGMLTVWIRRSRLASAPSPFRTVTVSV